MKVMVGADNSGYALKDAVVCHLREMGIEVDDQGTHGAERVLVSEYALGVGRGVAGGECDTGILICGTGQGMAMFANRVKGVRAALCNDIFTARMARQNNDANVLCLGSEIIGRDHALAVVDEWLNAGYLGREDDQIEKLKELDERTRADE